MHMQRDYSTCCLATLSAAFDVRTSCKIHVNINEAEENGYPKSTGRERYLSHAHLTRVSGCSGWSVIL